MTHRGWKIALAVSVALNVFGVAAGTAAWIAHDKTMARVQSGGGSAGDPPGFSQIMNQLDPSVRERVRSTLRASAEQARPDFQQARDLRQQAIALAASPNGGTDEILSLLDQSRAAERRGRERMERASVPLLATVSPADRQALSVLLKRRGNPKKSPATAAAPAPAEAPVRSEPPASPAP